MWNTWAERERTAGEEGQTAQGTHTAYSTVNLTGCYPVKFPENLQNKMQMNAFVYSLLLSCEYDELNSEIKV